MEVYGFCDRICRTKKGNNFILLAGDVTLKRILPSPAWKLAFQTYIYTVTIGIINIRCQMIQMLPLDN